MKKKEANKFTKEAKYKETTLNKIYNKIKNISIQAIKYSNQPSTYIIKN